MNLRLPIVCITLACGLPAARAAWVEHPAAVQLIYQNGVPHTDRNGVPMEHFDPARSFFPIGLYHALQGNLNGRMYRLADVADAGFNTAHLWEGQHLADVAAAARAAGVQLIIHWPTDAEVATFRDDPAMLGWYLDEEPTSNHLNQPAKPMAQWLAEFQTRRQQIRKLDPKHPVFAIDVPLITGPAREWWMKWNTAGDVSAHDNYPISPRRQTISYDWGIPQTVSLAVQSNSQRKPVWVVVQAFESYSPQYPFNMPTPRQLRAMTYTAVIHGATGIIDFALDSYVTRTGNVVAMAPDPPPQYPGGGIVATREQLAASRQLWIAAVALNKELKQLTPALLSPTAQIEYHVDLNSEWKPVSNEPICALLKADPAGGLILLLSNEDDAPQPVRIRFPGRTIKPQFLFDAPAASGLTHAGDHLELTAGPYAAFAIRL